jgi:MFS family permease
MGIGAESLFDPILDGDGGGSARTRGGPVLYTERYYMLGLFFVLMSNQCLFWFTFAADPPTFEAYFPGLTTSAIDLLTAWGPITFVPTVPVVMWLLTTPNGLRKCLRINACLAFCACALRMVPCLVSPRARDEHHWLLLLLHAAQILNGIAGPVLIAAPSRLSAMWFPPGQRTTVTAIANASPVGWAIAYFLCPAVLDGQKDNVPWLLLLTLGMAAVPLLCVAVRCPDHPPTPPSAAVSDGGPCMATCKVAATGAEARELTPLPGGD